MRRRIGLNKIGMLAIALLIALGAVGVAYSAWTDEIYIAGTFDTSGINTALDCDTCWYTVDDVVTNTLSTSITCEEDSQLEVTIKVEDALAVDNHTDLNDVDYYCRFTLDNTAAGSLPVKVQNLTVTPSASYADVDAAVTTDIGDVQPGDVLNPGDTATGKVRISLSSFASETLDLEFTLTANIVRWNQ
jgi:hypothetical protein